MPAVPVICIVVPIIVYVHARTAAGISTNSNATAASSAVTISAGTLNASAIVGIIPVIVNIVKVR
jgi:hypothetical protein